MNNYKENYNAHFSTFVFGKIHYYISQEIENQQKNLFVDYIGLNNPYVDENNNDFIYDSINRVIIEESLNSLSAKEKEILCLHLYNNYTFETISKIYNLTKQGIYEIYRKALNKVKTDLEQKEMNYNKIYKKNI